MKYMDWDCKLISNTFEHNSKIPTHIMRYELRADGKNTKAYTFTKTFLDSKLHAHGKQESQIEDQCIDKIKFDIDSGAILNQDEFYIKHNSQNFM